jgi:hypothetical protein
MTEIKYTALAFAIFYGIVSVVAFALVLRFFYKNFKKWL